MLPPLLSKWIDYSTNQVAQKRYKMYPLIIDLKLNINYVLLQI